MSDPMVAFAQRYGDHGPVCVTGGGYHRDVGGVPAPGTREVRAPSGIVAHEPAEMTVRVGAGTTLSELDAHLAAHGQCVGLEGPGSATVGGVLAVGRGDLRRRRFGPPRDSVLEIRYVSAEGAVVVAGGPTVKNVSGYDLCRLLVGSLGTLGGLGEVVLRTRPRVEASRWFSGPAHPAEVERALYRPACVLWDGITTWVLLEGYTADVAAQAGLLAGLGLGEAPGPPPLPPQRSSRPPGELHTLELVPGTFVAEWGIGVVHARSPLPAPPPPEPVVRLHRRIKAAFDPNGRCNPGRDPLRAATAGGA